MKGVWISVVFGFHNLPSQAKLSLVTTSICNTCDHEFPHGKQAPQLWAFRIEEQTGGEFMNFLELIVLPCFEAQ